ncbi:MAG: YndM family protein [Ectobacillus sp.]
MKHTTILLLKFISCIIAFAVGLDLFFDATATEVISFSIFVTAASYILGDRILLPRIGNAAAAVVDFLLVYTSVWLFGNVLLENYMQIAWGSIISACIITVAEVFVHRYLLNHIASCETREQKRVALSRQLAYEFAEDEEK